jgi:S-adenosylhomocysteine hydrolase
VLATIKGSIQKDATRFTRMVKRMVGVSEETTTGVHRLIEMANKNSTAPRFFIQLDYTNLRNDQKECARKLIMEI